MSTEKHVSNRTCLKSKLSRFILAIVVLIVIIVAVVPSVVVTTLHKKNSMGPKAKVFVPLYVYPAPEAWAPLENVYVSKPFLSFPLLPILPNCYAVASHIMLRRDIKIKQRKNTEKQPLNATGYPPTPMSTLPS